jgi:hypothetical protein
MFNKHLTFLLIILVLLVSRFVEEYIVSSFDTINHYKLMEIINRQIIDLLRKFLRVVIDNSYQEMIIGVYHLWNN